MEVEVLRKWTSNGVYEKQSHPHLQERWWWFYILQKLFFFSLSNMLFNYGIGLWEPSGLHQRLQSHTLPSMPTSLLSQSNTCWEISGWPKSGHFPQWTNSEPPFELLTPNYDFPQAWRPPFSTLASPTGGGRGWRFAAQTLVFLTDFPYRDLTYSLLSSSSIQKKFFSHQQVFSKMG